MCATNSSLRSRNTRHKPDSTTLRIWKRRLKATTATRLLVESLAKQLRYIVDVLVLMTRYFIVAVVLLGCEHDQEVRATSPQSGPPARDQRASRAAVAPPPMDAAQPRPPNQFPYETPVVSIKREAVGTTSLPAGALAIWQDGSIRYECPVGLNDALSAPTGSPMPVTHRGNVDVVRLRALLASLDRAGVFTSNPPKEHGGEDAWDCGWTKLELHTSAKTARLAHWGCATPTNLYVDAMRMISELIDSAPCDLKCDLFGRTMCTR
jgi:hypothetical protein